MSVYTPVYPATIESLTLHGRQYQLRRWGRRDGPLLILLHGWMDCAATFQFMLDAAPASLLDYQLVAPDMRGFGGSDWASESYYFPDYLADLDAMLDALGGDTPVTLVGHSMGGIIACLYAGIRPERVRKLVSLEGFGLPATQPDDAPARYRRWLDQRRVDAAIWPRADMADMAQRVRRNSPGLSPQQSLWLATQLAEQRDGQVHYRADPRHKWVNPVLYRLEEAQACWREVQARVLWLAAQETPMLKWLAETPDQFAARRACFASLDYAVLGHGGHNMHHDAPAEVAERIAVFLCAP
ncbi:alpha/beta fold hydrolase [Chitinimonas sp. BJYL2]|uniref:alpha/beta fold hydrolase n=1 Tax=Chitinimonas sp. BJYL2 TaxID=2976696 RepID=UPI0022B5B48B|nr:alpha/beta hydrolase [Chitinimonas sp. BJYL2]